MSSEGELPCTVLVTDFRLEEDSKTTASLLKVTEAIPKLHLALAQATGSSGHNAAVRLVQWSKTVDLPFATRSTFLSLVQTNSLSVEFLKRQVEVTASMVRRHQLLGKEVIPVVKERQDLWKTCWCDNPALCSSDCYRTCDTHKQLCNYHVAERPLPLLRQQMFLLVKQEGKHLLRTKSLANLER